MTRISLPVPAISYVKSLSKPAGGMKPFWFEEDGFILDVNCFVKTIATIKAKGASPDLIGSLIAQYASMRLPDLSGIVMANPDDTHQQQKSESVTAYLMKKRLFIETLIGILPPEKDSVSCNFLLRLLRIANMVGADPHYMADLEVRISWQLEQASLTELMITSFSHTCGTLLDVKLATRLVKKFSRLYNEGVKSSASLIKVAKLVDSYLAEAAVDCYLSLTEFISLADALPRHSRATEDVLYLAVDTYLKVHPNVTKQERRRLCGLIGIKKLSMEASLHAAENHRLPVRTVIQILFTEQTKLSHGRHNNNIDCNVSSLSRNCSGSQVSEPSPGWRMSKRDMNVQQAEIRRLRKGMEKLQIECEAMRRQLKKEKKGGTSSTGYTDGSKWYFRWSQFKFKKCFRSNVMDKMNGDEFGDNREGEEEFEYENRNPVLGDSIPKSGQVNNKEEPIVPIIRDHPMKRNRERRSLRKAMNKLMEKLVEDDRKIYTVTSSAQKIVDEATNHQDQNLPNLRKFGLLTKTPRTNNKIHIPDNCDPHTLKSEGSNQPISCYC